VAGSSLTAKLLEFENKISNGGLTATVERLSSFQNWKSDRDGGGGIGGDGDGDGVRDGDGQR